MVWGLIYKVMHTCGVVLTCAREWQVTIHMALARAICTRFFVVGAPPRPKRSHVSMVQISGDLGVCMWRYVQKTICMYVGGRRVEYGCQPAGTMCMVGFVASKYNVHGYGPFTSSTMCMVARHLQQVQCEIGRASCRERV